MLNRYRADRRRRNKKKIKTIFIAIEEISWKGWREEKKIKTTKRVRSQ